MKTTTLVLASTLAVPGLALAQTDSASKSNPVMKDRTGMRWVLPFKRAQEKARTEHRILMIKPVAFGTEASGGW